MRQSRERGRRSSGAIRGTQLHQAAVQRWKDACAHSEARRYAAAVYMAGYVVEFCLKAAICERTGKVCIDDWEAEVEKQSGRRPAVRGRQGHDLEQLAGWAGVRGEIRESPLLRREFAVVSEWAVEMRYEGDDGTRERAERFLRAVQALRSWLEERL